MTSASPPKPAVDMPELTLLFVRVYEIQHVPADKTHLLSRQMRSEYRIRMDKVELELRAWFVGVGESGREEGPITSHTPYPLSSSVSQKTCIAMHPDLEGGRTYRDLGRCRRCR